MRRRSVWLSLVAVALVILFSVSAIGSENQSLLCCACEKGVVDKAPKEPFTVEICFKNTGSTEGSWQINIAFEGENWTWMGTAQNLTLEHDQTKTLTWKGTVPADAPIDSAARLVVYHGDSFQALNWWIRVVQSAELTVSSSSVR